MMKKVLFCVENFQHGGINRALLNLIKSIDPQKLDVKIFVVNHEKGPYLEEFQSYLYQKKNILLYWLCTYYTKYKGFKRIFLLLLKGFRKILFNLLEIDILQVKLNQIGKEISNSNFDWVIAYSEGYITEFVSKINKNKIAWIHIDYKRYCCFYGNKIDSDLYNKFNFVITPGVSSQISFQELCSKLKDKVYSLPNFIDNNYIINKASESLPLLKSFTPLSYEFSIVSVGRICYEKRFYEIPNIASKLKSEGVNFKWYIIGDGSAKEKGFLMEKINDYGVNNEVNIVGFVDNPYPYIKSADLTVCLSHSETFCYVIFESKIIGTPVLSTNFEGITSIINNNEGIVAPIERFPEIIKGLYFNSNELNKLKVNLCRYNYNNKEILSKFYYLLNSCQ